MCQAVAYINMLNTKQNTLGENRLSGGLAVTPNCLDVASLTHHIQIQNSNGICWQMLGNISEHYAQKGSPSGTSFVELGRK